MSTIMTTYFGQLEYTDDLVYSFADGLPGFEEERAFVFLRQPDTEPLIFMQSLERPQLCFILLPVLAACPGYGLQLSAEDLEKLQLPADRAPRLGEDILAGALVCTAEETGPTVNLLAPIVLNLKARQGLQAIQCDTPYSHRQPLFEGEALATCS
jgi:flagellar assembly factor FliW